MAFTTRRRRWVVVVVALFALILYLNETDSVPEPGTAIKEKISEVVGTLGWVVGVIAALGLVFYLYRRRDRRYPAPERLAIIRNAMANGGDIWMVYFTFYSHTFSERTVTPLRIERGIYLRAFDHFRQKERTFKISRIKELSEIPRS